MEAFPIGDGRIGALVFGGTTVERIALNLDTFWSGVERDTTDPSRREAYERVRSLLLAGDSVAAEEASKAMQGPETESYQPVGELAVTIDDESECVRYARSLDLETGAVTTTFTLASGLEVSRHVSVRDGGIVVKTDANRDIVVTTELTSPHPMNGNVVEAPAHVVGLMTSLLGIATDEPITYGGGMKVEIDIATYGNDVRVSLGEPWSPSLPHDVLMRRASVDLGESNEWAGELFDFGRHLLASSSMPGTAAATLQGIWNVHRRPPWNSNYTVNINTQMNYWSANPAHMSECNEPLVRLIERIAENGRRTAEVDYGAPGWVAHHNTDHWGHTTAVGEGRAPSHWSAWPFGGVWLGRHLWEHYRYTGNEEFWNERALPLLRGAAEFVKATLVELPDGTLLTGPSTSPENSYATDASIALGVTCDRVLARELFTIVGDEATAARIPGEAVGRHGQIMEWFGDLDDPGDDHRHTSHLVGLYPGNSIDVDRTPELAAAARRTLEQRGPGAQGWAILWRACLWARLRDGDRAWELLERLNVPCPVEPAFGPVGGRYPNSFLAHPPFQIDANLGFPAAIIELLVQSHAGYVHLLPALPSAIPNGQIRGVLTHGGHEVNLRWAEGKLVEAEIGTGHEPLHLRIADGEIQRDVAGPDDVIRISR